MRLIRALIDAGVSVAETKRVVEALDSPPTSRHDLLGKAQYALPAHALRRRRQRRGARPARRRSAGTVSPDSPALQSLTGAIAAARSAGVPLSPSR